MRFDMDPQMVVDTAPTFTLAAGELATAVDELRVGLAELGAPWGGDAQGVAFAAGYSPKAGAVCSAADRVGAGLATVGDGVDAMGSNHAFTDAGVRSGLEPR